MMLMLRPGMDETHKRLVRVRKTRKGKSEFVVVKELTFAPGKPVEVKSEQDAIACARAINHTLVVVSQDEKGLWRVDDAATVEAERDAALLVASLPKHKRPCHLTMKQEQIVSEFETVGEYEDEGEPDDAEQPAG